MTRKRHPITLNFQWRFLWTLPLVFMFLQLVIVAALGFVWLYERQFFFYWILLGVFCSLAAWVVGWCWSTSRAKIPQLDVRNEEYWTNLEKRAFQEVETFAESLHYEDYDFRKMNDVLLTCREALARVAAVYHPNRKQPEYDVPLALVLLLFERVVHDLRIKLAEEVPGTYLFTIKDLMRIQTLYSMYRPIFNLYRVASFPLNPFSAVMRESKTYLNRQAVGAFNIKLRQMIFRYLFKLVGYYSVELYSGRLHFEDAHGSFTEFVRPLNFLFLGQSGAGKTTVLDRAFAGPHVKVHEVKTTESRTLRKYHVPDLGDVFATDTQGFEKDLLAPTLGELFRGADTPFARFRKDVLTTDVVFLISNMTTGKKADREFIHEFGVWLSENPAITPPIFIMILTGFEEIEDLRQCERDGEAYAAKLDALVQEYCESLQFPTENVVIPFSREENDPENGFHETLVTIIRQMSTEILRIQEARKMEETRVGRDFSKTAAQVGRLGAKLVKKFWKK